MTQEFVAVRVGLHVRNYGRLERAWPECRLRPEVAAKLAAIFVVTPEQLLESVTERDLTERERTPPEPPV
jgi:hypothetical protein